MNSAANPFAAFLEKRDALMMPLHKVALRPNIIKRLEERTHYVGEFVMEEHFVIWDGSPHVPEILEYLNELGLTSNSAPEAVKSNYWKSLKGQEHQNNPFAKQNALLSAIKLAERAAKEPAITSPLLITFREAGMSGRFYRCLEDKKIVFVGQALAGQMDHKDMRSLQGLGKKGMQEVLWVLDKLDQEGYPDMHIGSKYETLIGVRYREYATKYHGAAFDAFSAVRVAFDLPYHAYGSPVNFPPRHIAPPKPGPKSHLEKFMDAVRANPKLSALDTESLTELKTIAASHLRATR